MSIDPCAPASAEAAQPSDDAPHPNVGQTGCEIGNRRAFSNLGQGGIRHYDTGKRTDRQAPADRQRPGGDQLAGARAYDGGAEDLAPPIGHDLDMPHRLALGLGTVVLVIGPPQQADGETARSRLRLGQADMGELGVGEGHPRHEILVHLDGQAKQRVPDDEPGMVIGEMGELPPTAGSASPTTTLIFASAPSTRVTATLLRTSTPSRASASSTIAAHSPSSRASGCAASSTVTAAPRRRKAWASSRPMAPAPMTIRCCGRVVRSNTVSLVR